MSAAVGPLAGLRVIDLTRILAGPTATQMLGDLGADVIKIERPGGGDDTRAWGPPYLRDDAGTDTTEAAYFLSANRNKRSVTIDLGHDTGRELVRRMVSRADVFVENFKVGDMAKFGLAYEDLSTEAPGLVYCSISGFGQTGPYAARPGYDFLAQGMGGIMSLTGEPDGPPLKAGVGIADIMCGMYAAIAILAAVRHREQTGEGQRIDLGLLDTQVAWLANEGLSYLVSGRVPHRIGNAHPNIVPYQAFATQDSHVIIAVGNDAQFRRFCTFAGAPALADDARFATNAARVRHRDALIPQLETLVATRPTAAWLDGLQALKVPCGPVYSLDQVFADPQVRDRGMERRMPHPLGASNETPVISNPIRLSETPVTYRRPPPVLGEHTDEVLQDLLGLDRAAIDKLRADGVI